MRSNPDSMQDLAAPLAPARASAPSAGQAPARCAASCSPGSSSRWRSPASCWLRDSSLVRVRDVTVTGVTSSQEARVREALRRSALQMTTLHVHEDDL